MAIRETQVDLRYDLLKPPYRGHVLDGLLEERNLNDSVAYSGCHSFETEEEYNELNWLDLTLSAEESGFDPQTGHDKNRRTSAEMAEKFTNLPTFAEVDAEFAEYLAEYDAYAGKRNRTYPRVEQQMDMLFHDIESGLLGEAAKTSSFFTSIKQIKDENQ